MKIFHIVTLSIALLCQLPPSKGDLLISPKDLTVAVGHQATFTLTSNLILQEDTRVNFTFSYEDVVRVEPANITIPKGKLFTQDVTVFGLQAGHVDITATASPTTNVVDAFIKVTSEKSPDITVISITVGWIYFVVWSVSFYPQMYENWRRKSVVGLNFDYLALNIIGFSLYSLFTCGLYWIPAIQAEYFARNPHSGIPVQPNDIFFALHAVAVTLITIIQCFIYERGGQTISIVNRIIQGIFFTFLFISMLCSVFHVLAWLDFLYYCSYVKLAITLIKYLPQAYMNYKRKSTIGWSIGNILCDFTGGVLSCLQMILDAYNYNDWASIFLSPTKFGLGFFSIVFDIFFMIQHYILYRNQENQHDGYERIDGNNSPDLPTNSAATDPCIAEGVQGPLVKSPSRESVT